LIRKAYASEIKQTYESSKSNVGTINKH
jgi:hypothetical protein